MQLLKVLYKKVVLENESKNDYHEFYAFYGWKKKDIVSKSKNSPIVGMDLMGKVETTFNKGYISSF